MSLSNRHRTLLKIKSSFLEFLKNFEPAEFELLVGYLDNVVDAYRSRPIQLFGYLSTNDSANIEALETASPARNDRDLFRSGQVIEKFNVETGVSGKF